MYEFKTRHVLFCIKAFQPHKYPLELNVLSLCLPPSLPPTLTPTGNGQLVARLMDQALGKQERGCSKTIGNLLRQFLMEHGVIHKIDSENYLVPSAINPDPNLPLDLKLGQFPHQKQDHTSQDEESRHRIPDSPYKTSSPKLSLVGTGLIYRRMLHLPPIASGFWSKLISLCLQQEEILSLLSKGSSSGYETNVATNRLRAMLGNISIEWQYWKTGIMLIADDKLLLRVNSLQQDVFVDPRLQRVVSSALSKIQNFQYQEAGKWTSIQDHLTEVVEIVVPQMILQEDESRLFPRGGGASFRESLGAKLMAKVLELIDEILKNHCEHLAMNGIYTVNDMLHLIPCPLCYGDIDNRTSSNRTSDLETGQGQRGAEAPRAVRRAMTTQRKEIQNRPERALSKSMHMLGEVETEVSEAPPEALYTFRVDEVIQQTLVSDCLSCPGHGQLEIAHLAPDIVRPSPLQYHTYLHA